MGRKGQPRHTVSKAELADKDTVSPRESSSKCGYIVYDIQVDLMKARPLLNMTAQSTLLPPSDGDFGVATPSGLTPGTRSEAEAAFELNATTQTDSAAPDPSLDEAQQAYRRPGIPRTSSYNYEMALRRAQQSSVSSDLSTNTETPENVTGSTVASPPAGATPFPPPGQGVVPLNYGHVGASQGEPIKKTRSRGLSLGNLAKQQSWNEEDYKHMYSSKLVEDTKPDAGYGSATDKKVQGP